MNFPRSIRIVLGILLIAPLAQAQLQLSSGNFNNIFVAPAVAPVGGNQATLPATLNSNFNGMGQASGSSGPIDTTPETANDGAVISVTYADRYPSNPGNTLVLSQCTIGGIFASGVPLYFMGDEILPPLTDASGTRFTGATDKDLLDAARLYWRPKPVLPGENLPGIDGILTPKGSATVTASSTETTTLTVAASPAPQGLVVGAILLGEPVTRITGSGPYTVTLAGKASESISSASVRDITPATPFYYSPHADKVFASQPGQVTIQWVNRTEIATKAETFVVSASSQLPVRTIFWTEGSFDGPLVRISDARVTTVNPVYYGAVPKAVPEEVSIPGYQPVTPNLRTLYFDKFNGVGQLHAHNVEGRILIEYLGNVRLADQHDSLGVDIVEIRRQPEIHQVVQNLGTELTPRAPLEAGDELLEASPVLTNSQAAASFYGTAVRTDGTLAYYAERETAGTNDPDNGMPTSSDAFNKVVFYWMEAPPDNFGIRWPKFQSRYWQRWSPSLADYAHYTVDAAGSTPATGVSFSGGSLPSLIWQDDPANAEAKIDLATQRFYVTFGAYSDQRNRSLLKFSSGGLPWYVNLYSQAETRRTERSVDADGSNTVTLIGSTTSGLEVGMVVTGSGIPGGSATIVSITDSTRIVISKPASSTSNTSYTFTVESDNAAPISGTAIVGTRIEPPAGHEVSGYISGGQGYYPAGYLNPFTVGVTAANKGAIIPVNALPTDNQLTVRWFKKVSAPGVGFQNLFIPGKIGRYTVQYPAATTSQIHIAAGIGTGNLSTAEAQGSIYTQNVAGLPGYNPNEEHALMLGGRAYALREDLNVTTGGGYTSEPFVLVAYEDPADKRPAIHAYKVLRVADYNGNGVKDPGDIFFDYVATAGTLLVKPYPLPLMPLPLVGIGADRTSKDLEIIGADEPVNSAVGDQGAYQGFTFEDRKGFTWVHRGPHNTGSPTLSMKLYYLNRPGFFVPGSGEPPVDTILPFLRNPDRSGQPLNISSIDNDQIDEPLTIVYRPAWPTNVAELRVGETLTLPKFGLPQVRGQASAQVLYQQSIANDVDFGNDGTKNSVTLHDPTRQKTLDLGSGVLDALPAVIRTTSYQGKTYFQNLPPNLQRRFYLDPTSGLKGTLYFVGTYHNGADEGFSGDNYLDLNLLTADDEKLIKDLVPTGDNDKSKWDDAIDALKTSVETFIPDPARLGTYQVGSSTDVFATTGLNSRNPLAIIDSPDTAVDSYALTATGKGTGFVTMVFGNGGNSDQQPQGDPVEVKVFKIADKLYTGDLKVLLSSNPLDEQATLRHSGDFAGKPEDYEFEWRWAVGAASAPDTYTSTMIRKVGSPGATDQWWVVSDPGALTPTTAQYPGLAQTLGSRNVRPVAGIFNSQGELVNLPATQITVSDTAQLSVGMTVVGPGITGVATIISIIDGQKFVLSQVIADATANLTYGSSLELESTSSPLQSNVIDASSYTDADIAAGYPALVAKSSSGIDFGPVGYPLGVPEKIVFSAKLGSLDGCVLYVNGRVALAYNAPSPQFTLTNASTGLTALGDAANGGDASLKQFKIAPEYFVAGQNTIEVAIYTTADPNAYSDLDFILEAAGETDNVVAGSTWQSPGGQNSGTGLLPYSSSVLVGGSPTGPFGGPQFVLNDRWFTVRYRPKASSENVLGTPWSRWSPPQFVEGWIKRVLAAINPFEQRVKDLYNNSVNTDVSVITQAGQRWEGDIALTLDNINDVGLIEIYETVLNRGKNISINANTNDPDSNNALLLAAGYLNDLYSILGNEAYADAANPTISIDDPSSVFEVNTSRFSFEGQVESSLSEELALLRGRDDSVSPGVGSAPIYNRLIWNYTRGINSGEALYAVNYNIKEKAGSSSANGVIDESDARRMFPQGHGDAYGHYLTALTGYYRLLTNPNFDWQARAEAVTVNGQAVTVDFQDERKFAAAAGHLARTAQQVVALAHRQSYKDDPAAGWTSFRDSRAANPQTGVKSAQGLDEWVSRGTQGAYYNWVVGNALVPDVDTYHTGVQKIDRTTVPELPQLASAADTFQTTIDSANAHLNPLGLSPGAVAFDIDPYFTNSTSNGLQGKSHHEQIYDRALRSLNNAAGAFNQAATMTRSLRNQTNQLDDYNTVIVQQEVAFMNQLIDIFGRPYSGDIGPGKLYTQGYIGPDFHHWFIVDRPAELPDTSQSFDIFLEEVTDLNYYYTGDTLGQITDKLVNNTLAPQTVTIQPSQWVQYNDVWKSGGLGSRPITGELQEALQDAQETWLALNELNVVWQRDVARLNHLQRMFDDLMATHDDAEEELEERNEKILNLEKLVRDREIVAASFDDVADVANAIGDAFGPPVASKIVGATYMTIAKVIALSTRASARVQQTEILEKEQDLAEKLQELDFRPEEVQLAYEYDNLYRETVTGATELMQLLVPHQRALQRVNNVLTRGNRVLAERDVFRQRAAAVIQGYRTKDLSFRVFRNEALEQYRSLFDLASRYTYLSAKAYDYETGLLGSTQGSKVLANIVASRSLGDLTGGVPQNTTSTLGDAGLAGIMAQINADFSVAKGRLGINNPDYYGTVFSLRSELFRLLDTPGSTSGDEAWRQTLERHIVPNVLSDSDVVTHCRNIGKSDGSAVPGIIIEFGSTIQDGRNFFDRPLAAYDHTFSASSFATKISNAGIVLKGYVGMDPSIGGVVPTAQNSANALSGTPYVYLIPCGVDSMRAPLSGDSDLIRSWNVQDQALPLPYNLGASDFNTTNFFNANGSLSEQPWIIRQHQAFRAVGDPELFYGGTSPLEFSNSRLIGRSVWNTRWKIVIPAYTLLNDEKEGLKRFAASVKDVMLYLRTYSHSGN